MDEVDWRPGMFMKKETFDQRLKYLSKNNYSVLSLCDAVSLLKLSSLPLYPTVITIDDGWSDTLDIAHPLLKKWGFPYTIYLTSYYSLKQTPLFNIVVSYMFWKTNKQTITLDHPCLPFNGFFNIETPETRSSLSNSITDYGHSRLTCDHRVMVMRYLGELLDVDYDRIEQDRIFHLLNLDEIKIMVSDGVDFQLHTHRHHWPKDEQFALSELYENRKYLEPVHQKAMTHFCYPSGIWSEDQLSYLEKAGVDSATTCDYGMNNIGDNCLCLKRFLDGEGKKQIEFEAEISGFKVLAKRVIGIFK